MKDFISVMAGAIGSAFIYELRKIFVSVHYISTLTHTVHYISAHPQLSNYMNNCICSKLLTSVNDDNVKLVPFFPWCLFSIVLFILIINHLVGSVLIEKLRTNFCYYYDMIFVTRKRTRIMQTQLFLLKFKYSIFMRTSFRMPCKLADWHCTNFSI